MDLKDIHSRLLHYERLPMLCYVCSIIGHSKYEFQGDHRERMIYEGGYIMRDFQCYAMFVALLDILSMNVLRLKKVEFIVFSHFDLSTFLFSQKI